MVKQVCFVVMPFGIKKTDAPPPAPPEVDFDALWKLALEPALKELGYRAVRADQEVGSMIIKDMLERLYYSDLVVADISIPNANAYYEVGVRHAARNTGCVLIAADWARPVFDLGQIRHISYPNPSPQVDPATAARIREALGATVKAWADSPTPMLETIPGYPDVEENAERAHALADQLEALEAFRAELATVFDRPAAERPAAAAAIIAKYPAESIELAVVAVEMVKFVRDAAGDWSKTLAYIDGLAKNLQDLPWMREQRAMALSKQGDHLEAIAALKALIQLSGDSSARQGLLGGRYKRLYNESVKKGQPERKYLTDAIKHYERGMLLDLNDYFPSCNLPALYRERAGKADEAKAIAAAAVARTACESALLRGGGDEWLRPTLLGLAFAERNPEAAEAVAEKVEEEHCVGWKLETALPDLHRHVEQTKDPETKEALAAVADRLAALVQQE